MFWRFLTPWSAPKRYRSECSKGEAAKAKIEIERAVQLGPA
jgi:hypothetical protein